MEARLSAKALTLTLIAVVAVEVFGTLVSIVTVVSCDLEE